MLFYTLSALCIATFGLFSAGKSALPITTCNRNSVDFSACLKRAIKEAWPLFVAGLPKYDFPTLDPFFLERVKVEVELGVVHGKLIMSNLTAIGLSKTRFSDVRPHFLDDDVFRLEIDAELPWLFTEAIVDMDGILNMFGIVDKGYYNETAYNIKGTWDLTGHVVNDTWIVEHFRVAPSVAKFKIYFDNLIEKQGKEFNDLVVNLVNEYWPILYRIILPMTADIYEPWLVEYTNKFFSKVPFSEIFP